VATLGALAAGYTLWSRYDRHPPRVASREHTIKTCSFGQQGERGNLLGIQPWLTPGDYASEARFAACLDHYFAAAAKAGFLTPRTVAILPEHLGTWLAAVDEKVGVYTASTIESALSLTAAANLPAFLARLPQGREAAVGMAAVLRMKAHRMADVYHRTLSGITRRYGIYLVAGSIALPAPLVRDGVLHAGRGTINNVSALYTPEGLACAPLVRKAFPTEEELPFTGRGDHDQLPVFPTPIGRLGILICADAWFPACYQRLYAEGVDLVAAPSFSQYDPQTLRYWQGYSGAPNPPDVDPTDIQHLTQDAAWQKYALAGRLGTSRAVAGLNIFYRGILWEMHLAGVATAVIHNAVSTVSVTDEAALVNLWL